MGIKNGYAAPYNDSLIEKLRTIYHGGIPASIVLLSNGMSNGRCYDRAILLSRAFFDEEDEDFYPGDIERDKYIAPLILPMIEMTYGRPNELYSQLGIGLLQRKIEHYKNKIKYDEVVEEINEDMERVGLRKKRD